MTAEQIEKLAIKHEDFGFGEVDKYGIHTSQRTIPENNDDYGVSKVSC